MTPLSKPLRSRLEATVKAARDIAETAARAALEHLGVGEPKAPTHLTPEQAELRRRLRLHGRQLGDAFLPSPSGRGAGGEGASRVQEIRHLVWEVAYEHWHRMLFARFLAENHLLMHPDGVAVSLADCDDLAKDEGAADGWELAGRYAARMLPQVFRMDAPALQLRLAPEHQRELAKLVSGLDVDTFRASDSLGWVYQFWQAKRKDEVNASEVKIGADELPAVTQLFTEPYMVEFLLHNSLGAWWVTRHPDTPCPVPLTYLRTLPSPFGRGGEGASRIGAEGEAIVPPLPAGEGPGVRAFPERAQPSHHRNIPAEHIAFARQLRQAQTDAEGLIWSVLRDRRMANSKFRRQHPVGPYTLDFYCHDKRLAIELDGGQHNDAAGRAGDASRTEYLARQGIHVLRFWNNQVFQETEAVLEAIWAALHVDAPSPPAPLPVGEGGGAAVIPEDRGMIPAAGRFEGWPDDLKAFRLLDPCCGSGHFIVAAFHLLVPMRMQAEGLSAAEAVDAVIADNLHGLEIDPRCVEIAAFALALAAWTYPNLPSPPRGRAGGGGISSPLPPGEGPGVRALGFRPLPRFNIACCGLKVSAKADDWAALVPDDAPHAALMRQELKLLHASMREAPLLGSLLDPWRSLRNDLATSDYAGLQAMLSTALTQERADLLSDSEDLWDAAVSAQGLLDAARILAQHYHMVITNVPYLVRGKQSNLLKDYCASNYPEAKNDLATVFIERCYELTNDGGIIAIVSPQNWWFLQTYSSFRKWFLSNCQIDALVALGEEAWEYFGERGPLATLLLAGRKPPESSSAFLAINAVQPKSFDEKKSVLQSGTIEILPQSSQISNPDFRLTLELSKGGELLEQYAKSFEGLTSGDIDRFVFRFWDVGWRQPFAPFVQNAVETKYYTGRSDVIRWGTDGEVVAQFPGAYVKGMAAWGRRGLRITQMRILSVTLYAGEVFGKSAATLVPFDDEKLPAIWCYCTSEDYARAVRRIDQKVNVTVATLAKVPFDLSHWQQVATERYPNGLPKPYSDDPTQWIFHGHPKPCALTPDPSPGVRGGSDGLQVAVARLLGYRWPAESALTPGPSPGGRGEEEIELSDEARAWVVESAKLAALADDDGIACLPPVRGEKPAAERLLDLFIAAWGEDWRQGTLDKLLAQADCAGKSLDYWLRERFFEQHCKRFQHRPFIWHVWDGLKDGFAALVNYHKLDRKNLETLIYTYLGDWIRTQERGARDGVDGADLRLAAAQTLKTKLEKILEGEAPYDIFVRWKPLESQPIGWEPDLNDGVRLNIRPFMTLEVLRHNKKPKLNIAWEKDRGKDVESAPWFKVFKGDRINDHHLKLAEKRAARDRKGNSPC